MKSKQGSRYPEFFRLRQQFASQAIDDVSAAVAESMSEANLGKVIRSGQRVAIAVGSRGVTNLPAIVAAVVQSVLAVGGEPVIVPSMGSHGGATATGQIAMLASLGVTELSVGAPIVSSMDTILVGTTDDGLEVHFDRIASESDHVILINRIKPHTRLVGELESGLVKMLMIGMGKHQGATLYHQIFAGYRYRLDQLAPIVTAMILNRIPVTLGLAIVEDAFEQTSIIEAVTPQRFLTREPELLKIARARMPRLPFDPVDFLIIDKIGKEISGTGMDTNVIGRKSNDKLAAADEHPKVRQIYVRGLSEKSAGNACGIGIAEYCHRRVVEAMDSEATRINCVASAHVTAGAIPLTFDSDQQVFDAVLSQTGRTPIDKMKWIWIDDTLKLGELACSRGYWEAARDRDDLTVLSEPRPLEFDSDGNLIDLTNLL